MGTESSSDDASPRRPSRWRRIVPGACSLAMLYWLSRRFAGMNLTDAASTVDWYLMVPLVALLVLLLFAWDALCVRWLFSDQTGSISYLAALKARGTSYLGGAISYGLGQGVLAWLMSRARGLSLLTTLGMFVLLAWHDMVVLFALTYVCSLNGTDRRLLKTGRVCLIGLAITLGIAVTIWLLPQSARTRLAATRWGAWLGHWHLGRSLALCGLRLVNFALSMLFAYVGLRVMDPSVDATGVLTAVPLIQMAEALPISASGLGPRESILEFMLKPTEPQRVIVFGLIWSSGLLLGRAAIGLVFVWLGQRADRVDITHRMC